MCHNLILSSRRFADFSKTPALFWVWIRTIHKVPPKSRLFCCWPGANTPFYFYCFSLAHLLISRRTSLVDVSFPEKHQASFVGFLEIIEPDLQVC
jgi:hypothetical protein